MNTDEIGLLPFEQKIIDEFRPPIGEAPGLYGKGKMKPRLGLWIRGHLLKVDEDYPYRMWKRWNAICVTANAMGVGIPPNNYTQFVIYMWFLEINNLIKVAREEPYRLESSPQKRIRKKYYSVVEENLDSDLWNNPRKASPYYKKWHDIPEEKKEEYYKSRHLKAALRYAGRYGISLEEVPEELRGRRGIIPRKRESE